MKPPRWYRALAWTLAALFLVAAALQWNDPDPLRWMALYLGAAAASVGLLYRPGARIAALAVGGVALLWGAGLALENAHALQLSDLFLKMSEKGGAVEEGREAGGLLIVGLWLFPAFFLPFAGVTGAGPPEQAGAPEQRRRWIDRTRYPFALEAAVIGILHGLLARLTFGLDATNGVLGVMTGSFIFLVPFSIGALTVALVERRERWSWPARIFAPVIPAFIALMTSLILAWEGLICIFLWLPLYVVLAMLGGLVGGLLMSLLQLRRDQNLALMGLALLPYLAAPIEARLGRPEDIRVVENHIDIAASEETIWQHIVRVERFRPEEHHFALTHALGFPRPIEATLSAEGVGGVRHATFEGDVLFVETITDWEPRARLRFGIAADTSAIPATTLDEHVTVGGPFFDVLDGEYQFEPLGDGRVRLHLRSHHRVSTTFNAYATLWTDFIMSDVQSYILTILKQRCEAA